MAIQHSLSQSVVGVSWFNDITTKFSHDVTLCLLLYCGVF